MTTSTGEDRGLDPAAANRGAIPADTYAHRLMLARAHAGNLSIRAAADRCGLNYASWANWEQGTSSRTKVEDAKAISDELGVDLQWLLYGGRLAPAPPTQRDRRGRRGGGSLTRRYVTRPERVSSPATPISATRRNPIGSRPRDTRPPGQPLSAVRVKTDGLAA